MAVSGRHVRRGVATGIIEAAVIQAKSHGLPSIYLSTSSAQKVAIRMYKKFRWVEEKRQDVSVFGMTAQIVYMRRHLSRKTPGGANKE